VISRRQILQTAASAALASPLVLADNPAAAGRLNQSVARWCYRNMSLDDLCKNAKAIGLKGIDLLGKEDWPTVQGYGLTPAMGQPGAGTIPDAWNRLENHDALVKQMGENLTLAAAAKVPNVITFSGNRKGMSDAEGMANCVAGLNKVKKMAEDKGVTICLELLNSKIDHHDYMCDHTAWGVAVIDQVDSPRVKLLYDIYHMQIMEGDVIRTIRANITRIAHFHTGGVPGRHELDHTQELDWYAVGKAIADAGFQGFVAHEFVPAGPDPMKSLAQAYQTMTV
jgi:hydroxypyruvate isomerase